ncbi:hypothetical protein K440DRAFT_615561 [Wilcoxina mikolae CBS 423.85]|nr:hypothetical protein K440DRAFT_615561 [Wilcoxina mikolae CBS 423.85]
MDGTWWNGMYMHISLEVLVFLCKRMMLIRWCTSKYLRNVVTRQIFNITSRQQAQENCMYSPRKPFAGGDFRNDAPKYVPTHKVFLLLSQLVAGPVLMVSGLLVAYVMAVF